MAEETVATAAVEDVDPNPASTPGVSKMAAKFEALRETNPEAVAAAKADAAAPATTTPEAKAKAEADAAAKAAKSGNPLGDDIPQTITSKKAADDFRAIKKRAEAAEMKLMVAEKAADEKLKAMEAKIAAGGTVDPKKYEEAVAAATKYEGIVKTALVEFDPEFHAKYETRMKAVSDTLKAGLQDDAAFEKIVAAVQLPDGKYKQTQMTEALEALNDFQKMEVMQAYQDIRKIANERNAELTTSRQKYAELQKGKQDEAAAINARLSKAFEAATARVADAEKGVFLFQPKEGDAAWNQGVTERTAIAKHIFEGKFDSDEDRANAALWAAAGVPLLQDALATKKELAEVKAQLAKLAGASPEIKGAAIKGATEEPAGKGSFSGRVTAALNRS